MVLFISKSKAKSDTCSKIFHSMGVLAYSTTPEHAVQEISNRYKAIVIFDPLSINELTQFCQSMRKLSLGAGVFALNDDKKYDPNLIPKWCFDGILSDNQYSAEIYYQINRTLKSKGLCPIGIYKTCGIEASAEISGTYYHDDFVDLTRTETMILRYIVCNHPLPTKSKDILKHAFKANARLNLSNVRTHICSINKKFRLEFGKDALIVDYEGQGYILNFARKITMTFKNLTVDNG